MPTGLGELEANLHSIFEWMAVTGFSLASLIGLYMLWKIIRTPGEL